ncbi:MAG: hypothetical protein AAF503_08300 [Pseudomonadota bacterium]
MPLINHPLRPAFKLTGAVCLVGLAGLLAPGPAEAAGDAEDPTEIIAAQLRDQGYACENPEGAQRDDEDSEPGEQAWIVDCGNARYRVRLIPDQAAQVEHLL